MSVTGWGWGFVQSGRRAAARVLWGLGGWGGWDLGPGSGFHARMPTLCGPVPLG